MVATDYVPDRGHVVWMTFSDIKGHEQAGRRPALILSPAAANAVLGLAICCPITSKIKGYPFEVVLPPGLAANGAVLVDQIRSVDWRARNVELLCIAPSDVVASVGSLLSTLLPVDRENKN